LQKPSDSNGQVKKVCRLVPPLSVVGAQGGEIESWGCPVEKAGDLPKGEWRSKYKLIWHPDEGEGISEEEEEKVIKKQCSVKATQTNTQKNARSDEYQDPDNGRQEQASLSNTPNRSYW
jgi:hypothetical protein